MLHSMQPEGVPVLGAIGPRAGRCPSLLTHLSALVSNKSARPGLNHTFNYYPEKPAVSTVQCAVCVRYVSNCSLASPSPFPTGDRHPNQSQATDSLSLFTLALPAPRWTHGARLPCQAGQLCPSSMLSSCTGNKQLTVAHCRQLDAGLDTTQTPWGSTITQTAFKHPRIDHMISRSRAQTSPM
jgi:hypothetical protein